MTTNPDPRVRVFAVTTDLSMTGAKRVLVDGAVGIDRTRFHRGVLLLSPVGPDDPLRRELVAAGVDVHHVPVPARIHPPGLRALERWMESEGRPDIFHTHCARSAAIVRLAVWRRRRGPRPRVIVHFHGTVSARALRLKHRLLDRLLRPVTDLVISPTLHAARRGAQAHSFRGLPQRVVPNGVDLARVSRASRAPSTVRDSWGVPPGTRVVLLLGRWGAAKGHDVLLDAIPTVLSHPEDVRFVLVAPEGGGEYRASLERRIHQTALRRQVIMTGRDTDPGSCYAAADVVTMPSRDEPFGLVAVEAMAAGRSLVVARAGGLPEVCGDEAGVRWVRPGNPEALGQAIKAALAEPPAETAHRAACARRRAALFALPQYLDNLERAYADVLGRPELAPRPRPGADETSLETARAAVADPDAGARAPALVP